MTDACRVPNLANERPTKSCVSCAMRASSRSRVARDRCACVSQNILNSLCNSEGLQVEAGA